MLEKDRPGKLFVGGLAEDIDEKVLQREFSKFGRITESMVIRDKMRGVSRGFGFVTYENPIDAEEAIKHMDAKEIHGKKLHVEDAVRGGIHKDDSGRYGRDSGGGFRDGGFRGRGSRGPMSRGRGGPPRGRGGFPSRSDGPPRGGRGGYSDRGGSFSRGGGRGGGMMSRFDRSSSPPLRRDDSPGRSGMMSRTPSSRGRPMSGFDSRREDRYDSGFSDRGPPSRSRDPYGSPPPRDSGRSSSLLDKYSSSYRDSYPQSRTDDRGDGYSRGGGSRDYLAPRSELRDSPRDTYSTRGGDSYSMSSRDYPREPLGSRGGDRFDRDFDSATQRFTRELDSRGPPRGDTYMSRESGPPSRGYGGNSSLSSSSRAPPPFSSSRGPYPPGGSERRSSGDREFSAGTRRPAGPPPSRGGPPPPKRPRSDGPPSRGPPPPSFRR